MLLPPYNDFFKVGVSESGNHDNNIYNQNWSEQYHGLKVIAKGATTRGGVAQQGGPRGRATGASADGSGNADGNGNGNAGAVNPATAAAAALVDGSIAADDTLNAFQIRVPTTVELAP